jgi:hypothetical protein
MRRELKEKTVYQRFMCNPVTVIWQGYPVTLPVGLLVEQDYDRTHSTCWFVGDRSLHQCQLPFKNENIFKHDSTYRFIFVPESATDPFSQAKFTRLA